MILRLARKFTNGIMTGAVVETASALGVRRKEREKSGLFPGQIRRRKFTWEVGLNVTSKKNAHPKAPKLPRQVGGFIPN